MNEITWPWEAQDDHRASKEEEAMEKSENEWSEMVEENREGGKGAKEDRVLKTHGQHNGYL